MLRNSVRLAVALVPLAAGAAAAQGPTIEHRQIKCIVAGKHPRMDACFLPADVGQARVYFRVQGTPSWYYVDMTRAAAAAAAAPCHEGVLPKPQKKLVGQHIEYYVEASDRSFNPARTAEHAPRVVADAGECEPDAVAPISPTGPPGIFPGTPAALVGGGGGLSTVAVVGGLAGVGAAAGTVVVATRDDEPEQFALQVARAGTGSGRVSSAPAGIDCGGSCAASFAGGTQVTLTAEADGGSSFAGWEGACSGTGACTVTMDAARSVTARFTGRFTLSVAKTGNGTGTVSSAPAGIDCGAACSAAYDGGTTVVLTAAATGGSTFTGWGGACSGTGPCSVVMDAARSVTANFTAPGVRLTVVKAGSGTGTVTSSPAGIDCGSSCTSGFPLGTQVTLTAAPAAGSVFLGWTGGGCSGTGTCTVTMDSGKAVTATFEGSLMLSVSVGGTGSGSVTSRPGGINCGVGNTGTCAASYNFGTVVDLTAVAAAGTVFVGWGGECAGTVGTTCRVIMDDARSVTATFSGKKHLDVVKAGAGSGTVTSSPAGINCGGTCSAEYDVGTPVTLTATPDGSSIFTGWSGGGCSGTTPCTVVMNSDVTVTATFAPASFQLRVTVDGPGSVTAAQGQITNCTSTCTGTYPNGSTVDLTAFTTGDGAEFMGWSGGGCSGTGGCSVAMTQNRDVTATFGWPMTVNKSGTGSGTVTSSPGGINCGADCDEVFRQGTPVTLTAVAAAGSDFTGWSGGGCSGTGTCSVTMNNAAFVTADFELVRRLTVTVTTCTVGPCDGRVFSNSAVPGEPLIDCSAVQGGPPTVCSASYPDATAVRLVASSSKTFVAWGGACAGTFGDFCDVTMTGDLSVTADFRNLGAARGPGAGPNEALASGPSLSWISVLEAPGAEGQVVFNGQQAGFAGPGVARLSASTRAGDNRVEARLQKAQGQPGTWRFELQSRDALEPGSLRVLQGEPVMVLPEAIVFRVSGAVGEQVAFTYRIKKP
jgi:hypothetical protein